MVDVIYNNEFLFYWRKIKKNMTIIMSRYYFTDKIEKIYKIPEIRLIHKSL
jgi:hypothetical protein